MKYELLLLSYGALAGAILGIIFSILFLCSHQTVIEDHEILIGNFLGHKNLMVVKILQ